MTEPAAPLANFAVQQREAFGGGCSAVEPFVPPPNWGLPPSFGRPKPFASAGESPYGANGDQGAPLDPSSIPHAGGLPYGANGDQGASQGRPDDLRGGGRPDNSTDLRKGEGADKGGPNSHDLQNEPQSGKKGISSDDVLKMDSDGLETSAAKMYSTGEGIEKLAAGVTVGAGAAKSMANTHVAQACAKLDQALKKSFRDAGDWPKSSAGKLSETVKEVTNTDVDSAASVKQVDDLIANAARSTAK